MKIYQILFAIVVLHPSLSFSATDNSAIEYFEDTEIVDYVDGYPITSDNRLVVEVDESGEMITMPLDTYLESKGSNFLNLIANYFDFKKTFQTVTSYITPLMEERFELFVIVNVDYRNLAYGNDKIPSQHMRIIKKTSPGQKVFTRNSQGWITGLNSDLPGASSQSGPAYDCLEGSGRGFIEGSGLIKVSSGAGRSHRNTPWWDNDAYLDTPTGVYRFNDSRNSLGYRGKNKHQQRVMWTPLYFDLTYRIPRGNDAQGNPREPLEKESGLAMHGTSNGAYAQLGSQASHGCVRTRKEISQCVKKQFHDLGSNLRRDSGNGGPLIQSSLSDHTPHLEPRLRLKSEIYNDRNQLLVKPGTPALFIIFYGYDESLETGEIIEI